MKVELLAHTQLATGVQLGDYAHTEWLHDQITDGQLVSLAAIRQCYSYKTAKEVLQSESEKYFSENGKEANRLFKLIVKSGHTSTLEHLNFTFNIEGVSRSLLAQLTRHRHMSFSVQSQRYTKKFTGEINDIKKDEERYKNKEKRHGHCKLTIGEELRVVDMYKSGLSTRQIAKVVGLFHTSINGILDAHGVEKRKGNESVVDHDYFEKIDSHRKAQILGFICADGSVGVYSKDKDIPYTSYQLGIEVNKIDGYYLEGILDELQSRNSLSESKRGTNSICIVSEKIVKDLENLGVVQNKTMTLDLTNVIEKIPKEFINSFMLGYFEGDGYINKPTSDNSLIITTGSETCANQLKDIFENYCGINNVKIRKEEDGIRVGIYSYKEIEKALLWMYKDIELENVLKRKLIIASSSYSEVDFMRKNKLLKIAENYDFVLPEIILNKPEATFVMLDYFKAFKDSYVNMIASGIPQEDARAVLPNAATTNLVLTANLRTLLDFYGKRKAGKGAQHEITVLAEELKKRVVEVEPWTEEFF